jgi:hypothetical protein
LAFIDETGKWTGPGPDPRQAGATNIAPAHFNPAEIPTVTIPQGYKAADWTKLLQGNSNYMGWELNAGQRADQAAAQRKAALQALAVRYGGLPAGFKDIYGDLTPDIQGVAGSNPLSESARIERDYGQSQENYKRGLAARGALQSGDLGYGLGELDYQHSADLYNMGNDFLSAAQGAVNDYSSALSGLSQEQIDAIRNAAASVYGQGYRLSGTGNAAPGGGGLTMGVDWNPDARASLAGSGYSDEDVAMAVNGFAAQRGWGIDPVNGRVGQVVQEGIHHDSNGNAYVMVKFWDGTGYTTEQVPLPAPAATTSQAPPPPPGGDTAPAAPPVVQAPTTAPNVTVGGAVSPTDLINAYLGSRAGV